MINETITDADYKPVPGAYDVHRLVYFVGGPAAGTETEVRERDRYVTIRYATQNGDILYIIHVVRFASAHGYGIDSDDEMWYAAPVGMTTREVLLRLWDSYTRYYGVEVL